MQYINPKDPVSAHLRAGMPITGLGWSDYETEGDVFDGVVFYRCTFERVRMRGVSFWQAMFVECRFEDCVFTDCRFFRTQWAKCEGTHVVIRGGELSESNFAECTLNVLEIEQSGDRIGLQGVEAERLVFSGAGLEQHAAAIVDCTFSEVCAENARWMAVSAVNASLEPWRLTNAVLTQCVLIECRAPGLDFSRVTFDRCNLHRSNLAGATLRSAAGSLFSETGLENADLCGADLEGALFAGAQASGARFARARLAGALFPEAVLARADFTDAVAEKSVWTGADLRGAVLDGVNAFRASFRDARLDDASVDGARFVEADLHGVEASLTGADTTDARETLGWRGDLDARALSNAPSSPRSAPTG